MSLWVLIRHLSEEGSNLFARAAPLGEKINQENFILVTCQWQKLLIAIARLNHSKTFLVRFYGQKLGLESFLSFLIAYDS